MLPNRLGRTVLVVGSLEDDYLGLRNMLRQSNWHCEWVPTYAEALTMLDEESIPIVICEHRLPDGMWRDFISETSLKSDPPIVLVATAESSLSLFKRVRESGGHDVLTRPFESFEVLDVLSNARREWYRKTYH